jgi:hypothetical protein
LGESAAVDAKLPMCSLLPLGYFPLEADLRLNRDIEFQSNTYQTTMETVVDVQLVQLGSRMQLG